MFTIDHIIMTEHLQNFHFVNQVWKSNVHILIIIQITFVHSVCGE